MKRGMRWMLRENEGCFFSQSGGRVKYPLLGRKLGKLGVTLIDQLLCVLSMLLCLPPNLWPS